MTRTTNTIVTPFPLSYASMENALRGWAALVELAVEEANSATRQARIEERAEYLRRLYRGVAATADPVGMEWVWRGPIGLEDS